MQWWESTVRGDDLVPVGKVLGVQPDDGDAFGLRVGTAQYSLTAPALDLWWAVRQHPSRSSLVEWGRKSKIVDADRAVEQMIKAGMLTQVDSVLGYAIHSNGWGLGASHDNNSFTIADLSLEPLCEVDGYSYLIWSLADGNVTGGDLAKVVAHDRKEDLVEVERQTKISIAKLVRFVVLELHPRC